MLTSRTLRIAGGRGPQEEARPAARPSTPSTSAWRSLTDIHSTWGARKSGKAGGVARCHAPVCCLKGRERLEREPRHELQQAREAARAGDLAEARGAEDGVGPVELRVVEDVDDLGPEHDRA